ncbi:MAG TPA: galactose-1-phosphate uridylyltransferase [Candidatus Latescibacteria bacterium]|nr:galactose-1-phosphate uridylyltransferase [Candidatus Latescibacterota bacterium]
MPVASSLRPRPPYYDPKQWELRWHPLRGEWVVIAAHRDTRPWKGGSVSRPPKEPEYDPTCYLCPGNTRTTGGVNPRYRTTFAFDNDFPPAGTSSPLQSSSHGLYRAAQAYGRCRVMCFHPRHDLTLATMDVQEIRRVLSMWQREYRLLGEDPRVKHVLIFENKGEITGTSNRHPHCQAYGTTFIFSTIQREIQLAKRFFRRTGTPLYRAVIEQELEDGCRIIARRGSIIAFVPYFARYPYEVHVAPLESRPSIADLAGSEVDDLASVLKAVLVRYDNLFTMPFPYVQVLHQAPTDGTHHPEFHFHIEFYPPLRNPVTLKYLAGPEIGGGNMLSDVAPEEKAKELQVQSEIHYSRRV